MSSRVVLLRIRAGQVEEAIFALGLHGFPEVRAYDGRPDESPGEVTG